MLPCTHKQEIVQQIEPTKELLKNLHTLHPDILREHNITPGSYLDEMVFRSAVESIRGTYIASAQKEREHGVQALLQALKDKHEIHDFEYTGGGARCDFKVNITRTYEAGLEVKGGEGNSIQISDKPANAEEFAIWSHLDGSIQNPPSEGAHKVIGRILTEMSKEIKRVDALFVRDRLCNTGLRKCPKYAGRHVSGLGVAPDIFLFPSKLVTVADPNPPMNTLDGLKLPKLMLELFDVPEERWLEHVWEVQICLVTNGQTQIELGQQPAPLVRTTTIWHQGRQVDKFRDKNR